MDQQEEGIIIYYLKIKKDNLVAASDAFFPFQDGIEKLVQSGVRAVVQPSGSIRDKEIINFANETDTVLLFSNTRHFKHQIFDLFLQQE